MAGIQDLINVKFQDNTNYVSFTGEDVLGVVMEHHWGPADDLQVLDISSFRENYPESLPIGATSVDYIKYYAFAQVKKAFELGISKVEVYRPTHSKWKYNQFNLKGTALTSVQADSQFDSSADISFSTRYPGYVPQSLAPNYKNLAVEVNIKDSVITVKVKGKTDSGSYETIEEFEGGTNIQQYVDGQSFYLPTVLEKSKFIRCSINKEDVQDISSSPSKDFEEFTGIELFLNPSSDAELVKSIYTDVFGDIEQSTASLLISPFSSKEIDATLIDVAASRKDLNSVIGYPLSEPFNKDSISSYLESIKRDKFSFFVAGREIISVFGASIASNCTGGWCGTTASVASSVRLNQLASCRTYGKYQGVLSDSLKFGDVLTLHEMGVISVYRSFTGPQIFGVRSLYSKQASYFGKANVMRVTAAILKQVFPIVIDAIHTDVAANPVTRSSVSTQLNSIIDKFVANQNLRSQSNADCSDELNTDYLTNGGTKFNIELNLWYIGLTERVNITVVATDSSVSAEIS